METKKRAPGAGRKRGKDGKRTTLLIHMSDLAILNSIDDSPTLALRKLIAQHGEALDEIKRLKDTKRTKLELARAALTTPPTTAPRSEPVTEPVKRKRSYGVGEFDPFEGE